MRIVLNKKSNFQFNFPLSFREKTIDEIKQEFTDMANELKEIYSEEKLEDVYSILESLKKSRQMIS